jgi:Gas vesicle protein
VKARSLPNLGARAQELLETADASLLDVIDHVLNKGVVLQGEVLLAVADVDLVYLRLTALLCAADLVETKAST